MNLMAHICPWLALACFATAVAWAVLLLVDALTRAKLPAWGGMLSVISLFAVSLMSLGGMVIFSEIAQHQRGQRGPIDGVMLFVLIAVAGAALQVAVLTVLILVWLSKRKRSV